MMSTDTTIDILNTLIETSKDGEHGFRTSAEHVHSSALKDIFKHRATECAQAAADLQSLVARMGGKAEDTGTAVGAAHRGWVAVKGTLAGYTDLAILEETERGEDSALKSYRAALQKDLPADVRATIERQLEGVKRNHAEVRRLRDHARVAAH